VVEVRAAAFALRARERRVLRYALWAEEEVKAVAVVVGRVLAEPPEAVAAGAAGAAVATCEMSASAGETASTSL
jgi:hypothetical protein